VRRGAMAAVDHEPAALEQADADARARSAPQPRRVAPRIERQSMQATQSSRDAERELRARAETGVGRDGFLNRNTVGTIEIERALQRFDVMAHALGVGSDDLGAPREADAQSRARAADGEAQTAEAAAEAAVEIEKAEMQARRRAD